MNAWVPTQALKIKEANSSLRFEDLKCPCVSKGLAETSGVDPKSCRGLTGTLEYNCNLILTHPGRALWVLTVVLDSQGEKLRHGKGMEMTSSFTVSGSSLHKQLMLTHYIKSLPFLPLEHGQEKNGFKSPVSCQPAAPLCPPRLMEALFTPVPPCRKCRRGECASVGRQREESIRNPSSFRNIN